MDRKKKDKAVSGNEMIELNILDQQLRQLEENARKIEQAIYEQQFMELSLDEIKGKKNSDVMIPLGPGLFIQGKIESTDKVLVHIGGKIISKKSIEDAKKIIEKRKDGMMKEGDRLSIEMQKILEEMTRLESKIRGQQGGHAHTHQHEHECSCEDENCEECE